MPQIRQVKFRDVCITALCAVLCFAGTFECSGSGDTTAPDSNTPPPVVIPGTGGTGGTGTGPPGLPTDPGAGGPGPTPVGRSR